MRLGIDATFTPYGGSKVQIIYIINYFAKNKDIELFVYTKKSNNLIFEDDLKIELHLDIATFQIFLKYSELYGDKYFFPIMPQLTS